jgi:hypothetical protein
LHERSTNLTLNQRLNNFFTWCTVGWMVHNSYLLSSL